MIPVLHGVWAAAGGLVNDFEHIETQTVGAGGAASITFSSIPGTYKHLQIRTIGRNTGSSVTDAMLRFNGDTSTSNYVTYHYLYGNGAVAGSGGALTGIYAGLLIDGYLPGTATTSGIFNAAVIDLLDYASTSKNKTGRSLAGLDSNGSGVMALFSGLWLSTSAISSITILQPSANNFAQHTTFSLYGVK